MVAYRKVKASLGIAPLKSSQMQIQVAEQFKALTLSNIRMKPESSAAAAQDDEDVRSMTVKRKGQVRMHACMHASRRRTLNQSQDTFLFVYLMCYNASHKRMRLKAWALAASLDLNIRRFVAVCTFGQWRGSTPKELQRILISRPRSPQRVLH